MNIRSAQRRASGSVADLRGSVASAAALDGTADITAAASRARDCTRWTMYYISLRLVGDHRHLFGTACDLR
jgi:hypothetical protein